MMAHARLILLPGLHGTGELYTPLVQCIAPELRPSVISYPTHRTLDYEQLLGLVEDELLHEPELILLAESFSGPLAIRYAARHPQQVRALVLSNTFIRSPLRSPLMKVFIWFMRSPPPKTLLRWLLLGRNAPRAICRWVQRAIGRVDARVIAHRLREVQGVDAAEDLARCRCPILYLQSRDDALVRPPSLRNMLCINPRITVELLSGPHMLFQVHQAESWRAIARFLESLQP